MTLPHLCNGLYIGARCVQMVRGSHTYHDLHYDRRLLNNQMEPTWFKYKGHTIVSSGSLSFIKYVNEVLVSSRGDT